MTQHLHSTFEPECFRCQLSRDEARAAMLDVAEEFLEQLELFLVEPAVVEATGRAMGQVLNDLDNEDQASTEWHRCASCRTDGPCPCAGECYADSAVIAAGLAALLLQAKERVESLRGP